MASPVLISLPSIRLAVRIYRRGVQEAILLVSEKLAEGLTELTRSIPNPIKILNALVKLATGWMGVVITIPELGVMGELKDALKALKANQRVIRSDVAILSGPENLRNFVTVLTNTNENTLRQQLTQSFTTWIYNTVKKVKFLRALIRAQTALEFGDVFDKRLESVIRKFKLLAFYLLGVAAITKLAFLISAFATAWLMEQELLESSLPNDSERVWRKHSGAHRRRK